MSVLHTLSDGSVLRVLDSRDLLRIPIWKGNRVIDHTHVANIRAAIGNNVRRLDFGYRIVTYSTFDAAGNSVNESYIVDGQHRARVLSEYYAANPDESDFRIVVLEKQAQSELEVIDYFNALNNAKPIKYTDVNLIVNTYISELEREFNRTKTLLIRPKATCRPYLSSEKLREALHKHKDLLRGGSHVTAFVNRVRAWNSEQLVRNEDDPDKLAIFQKGCKEGFMLAIDPKLKWIPALLA
jgi:hypothetical protein